MGRQGAPNGRRGRQQGGAYTQRYATGLGPLSNEIETCDQMAYHEQLQVISNLGHAEYQMEQRSLDNIKELKNQHS